MFFRVLSSWILTVSNCGYSDSCGQLVPIRQRYTADLLFLLGNGGKIVLILHMDEDST